MRALLAAVLLALALAGCATGAPDAPATEPDVPPPPVEMLPPIVPDSVEIPSIGAQSSLVALGRGPDGGWAVPDVQHPEQASWYSDGPVPGSRGPAVILGHVNGGGRPGVFARLGELQAGAEVLVRGQDGRTVTFVVTRIQRELKTAFPSGEVFAAVPDAQLRLITCGDRFDPSTGHYVGSVIAYAVARL